MNNQEIVDHMVDFVTSKEQQYQNNKLVSDSQIRSDMVKSILDELERAITNENK